MEEEYDHFAHLMKGPDDAAKYGYGEDEYEYDHYARMTKESDDAAKYAYGDDPTEDQNYPSSRAERPHRATLNHYTKTPRRSSQLVDVFLQRRSFNDNSNKRPRRKTFQTLVWREGL